MISRQKAVALLHLIAHDLGRPVLVDAILDRYGIDVRTWRRWVHDLREAGFALVDAGHGAARTVAIYRVKGPGGRRIQADPLAPPADVITDRPIADRSNEGEAERARAGDEPGEPARRADLAHEGPADPLPPGGSTDPGVSAATRAVLAQDLRERLAERLRTGAFPPARCACGEEVPEARRCYAVPTCYGCLPPPEPLPVRRIGDRFGCVVDPELVIGVDHGHPDGDRVTLVKVDTSGISVTLEGIEGATLRAAPLIDQVLGEAGELLGVPGYQLPKERARQAARLTWSRGLLHAWEAVIADDGGPSAGCGVRLERGEEAAVARIVVLSPNGEELREIPVPPGRATLAGARAAVVEDLARAQINRTSSGRSDGGS